MSILTPGLADQLAAARSISPDLTPERAGAAAELARLRIENSRLLTESEKAKRLRAIVKAAEPLFEDMLATVAGWQRDRSFKRHPSDLCSTLKTTCGVVYAVTDCIKSMTKESGAPAENSKMTPGEGDEASELEIWLPIFGYEGHYEVSNCGRVRRISVCRRSPIPGGALKPWVDRKGYEVVNLSKGGTVKNFKPHRLVAEAFLPNPDGKPEVNHIDRNRRNNRLSNLEFCTTSENQIWRYKGADQEKDHTKQSVLSIVDAY